MDWDSAQDVADCLMLLPCFWPDCLHWIFAPTATIRGQEPGCSAVCSKSSSYSFKGKKRCSHTLLHISNLWCLKSYFSMKWCCTSQRTSCFVCFLHEFCLEFVVFLYYPECLLQTRESFSFFQAQHVLCVKNFDTCRKWKSGLDLGSSSWQKQAHHKLHKQLCQWTGFAMSWNCGCSNWTKWNEMKTVVWCKSDLKYNNCIKIHMA